MTYEMLVGQPPFKGYTEEDTTNFILTGARGSSLGSFARTHASTRERAFAALATHSLYHTGRRWSTRRTAPCRGPNTALAASMRTRC